MQFVCWFRLIHVPSMLQAIILCTVFTTVLGSSSAPTVTLAEGQTSGVKEVSSEGREFYSYYNIPFAKPPVGELRFKDPEPSEPWEGVRSGAEHPEYCLQVPLIFSLKGLRASIDEVVGSEDCLYLNVFTPVNKDPAKLLPVMVWMHGGGFFSGGAIEYQPYALLNHEVVLVVLQYRLGILGFLSTEDEVMPGNFGLKDQTLALRWVQDNIHTFGGDAKRVTIFGESAGGAAVNLHMLSPKSEGLFKRVIMQSGNALSPWAVDSRHREAAEYTGVISNCSDTTKSDALMRCLQSADARELVTLSQDFFEWFIFPLRLSPRVDGDFLPDDPEVLMKEGHVAPVYLISGVTAHEMSFLVNELLANDKMRSSLQDNFSTYGHLSLSIDPDDTDPASIATKMYQYYLGDILIDEGHKEQLSRLHSDRSFTVSQAWTELLHSRVAKTYRYSLDYRGDMSLNNFFEPGKRSEYVSHCDDLFYLFRRGPFLNPPQKPPTHPDDLVSQDDLALRKVITSTWTNFAATGNPTPDDSLGFKWEPVSTDDLRYLSLKPSPSMEEDDMQEIRNFHASLPTKQNLLLSPGVDETDDSLEGDERPAEHLEMPDAEDAFSRQFNQDEL